MNYRENKLYFRLDGETLIQKPLSEIGDEELEAFCSIEEAVSLVQTYGCVGFCQHKIRNDYHRTALAVLKMAVELYGEVFPVLYRGTRSSRPLDEHLILFGTTDMEIASWYGEVVEHRSVKGLRTLSTKISVVTEDYSRRDEEIIFFP